MLFNVCERRNLLEKQLNKEKTGEHETNATVKVSPATSANCTKTKEGMLLKIK